MFDRIVRWVRRWNAVELPCGCQAWDGRPAPWSEYVSDLEYEHVEVGRKRYTNATVVDYDGVYQVQCDQCGAVWKEQTGGSRKTDFGDENPDAEFKLDIEHRPGLLGGTWVHHDVPLVEDGGEGA